MDVAFLLDKYFKDAGKVSIDVFDAQSLNTVYKDVVSAMTSHFEIDPNLHRRYKVISESVKTTD